MEIISSKFFRAARFKFSTDKWLNKDLLENASPTNFISLFEYLESNKSVTSCFVFAEGASKIIYSLFLNSYKAK